ncbi:hypothetical protein GWK47_001929 [Chionoecetes opilio]|uniref:Uncharacterized protein n=1 Tax=Chionoecetes opilio TaxID=41210 RepID=A0A8J4XRJ2_CHIOP|nr:hypothetical protein GWK47_001929 [Chionoecetes opilio]
MSCAASHTRRMDSIQRRALRLVDAADPPYPPAQFEPVSLSTHWNTTGTSRRLWSRRHRCRECHTWLGYDSLRDSPREAREWCLPVVMQWRCRVPLASQHQRTFVGRVARMWNIFKAAVPHIQEMNTQSVNLAANRWRLSKPTPLTLVIL